MGRRFDAWSARAVIALALLGLALSLYLFNHHLVPVESSFCDINTHVSCTVVDQSPYAELFGIPISFLGILYWFGVLAAMLIPDRLARIVTLGDRKLFRQAFLGYVILGALFTLYLTAIEAFVLRVWCPLCVIDAIAVAIVLAIAAARVKY